MKVAVPLAKNISAPLGNTIAASAVDTRIEKKFTWFWNNKEINDIMKTGSSS